MSDRSHDSHSPEPRPPQFGIAGALGAITAIAVLIGTLRALDFDVLGLLMLLGIFAVAILAGLAVIFATSFSTRQRDNASDEIESEQRKDRTPGD